jgi:malonate transporter MadM subunit
MFDALAGVLARYHLLTALALVGVLAGLAHLAAERWLRGRVHWSALAILAGLGLALWGGWETGGKQGLADLPMFAGLAMLGGPMLRDLAIVATAFGVRLEELKGGGLVGAVSLLLGLTVSFGFGGAVAYAWGYRDAASLTTIGAGAATYIVGPVTGTAVGADSEVIALAVGAGLVKAVSVMVVTPWVARWIGLDNPRAAMVFGGLMGTNSGVMAGLAATDPKLVPYGAMTATFYTGLGCLLGPSVYYGMARWLTG